MSLRERKQSLMEEVMKVNDESIVKELETILLKSRGKSIARKVSKKKSSFSELCGVISKVEGERWKKAVEEMFETVDLNEWK